MNYDKIVRTVIEKYKTSPIDLLGNGDEIGEYNYLLSLKDTYIRTVRDVDKLFDSNNDERNILELGSFLGPVSISLKNLGYNVWATDIPEFYGSPTLKHLYESNNIPFNGLNLREYKLPYESNSFDVVILCEVLEHLSFNPLPVIAEINRVLKDGGYIYIGMPNQARIRTRLKALFGKSIHNPISDFFDQLDREKNMLVGLHWREYTLNETVEIIEEMGFETIDKYYFDSMDDKSSNIVRKVIKKALFSYAAFRPFQVVVGRKVSTPVHNFWLTDANS